MFTISNMITKRYMMANNIVYQFLSMILEYWVLFSISLILIWYFYFLGKKCGHYQRNTMWQFRSDPLPFYEHLTSWELDGLIPSYCYPFLHHNPNLMVYSKIYDKISYLFMIILKSINFCNGELFWGLASDHKAFWYIVYMFNGIIT